MYRCVREEEVKERRCARYEQKRTSVVASEENLSLFLDDKQRPKVTLGYQHGPSDKLLLASSRTARLSFQGSSTKIFYV